MNTKRRTRVQELPTYSMRVHKSRTRRTSVRELKTRRTEVHQSRERQARVLTPRTCHISTRSTECADAIITPRDEDENDSLQRADLMNTFIVQHQPHRLPRFTEKVYFDLIITLLRFDRRQTQDCDWGVNPMSAIGRGMVTL